MPVVPRKPAKHLWDRIWVRLPAYLFGAPIIIMVMDLVIAVLFVLAMGGDVANIASAMALIAVLAAMQVVPLIVPLILVELGNRRRGWAVPPGLCALFVAVFSVAIAGTGYGSAQMINNIPNAQSLTDSMPFAVVFVLGCCVVAGAISWALVSPLIRRWAARNASAERLSEHF